ncbi:DUF1850 domain-containing protein [Phyllobacterium endophyticum]|uniref:DUF1850 domain-containing protein n=1 Tax=Phyllobacterium endophyticum TaxID=1149773 RepID=A0A2P7AU61_9HYPH|nr:DUF1850 domain-containing protein [Phyllobacterium endophyticum]MBB3234206.1 hypothetical protein [Phyllobacterium endophyticum]PSH57760.1 DUF1850 domain-containing protein [Phyllobacterium endophyticum]TYR43957.1 DUF1850 domain-containing protein [Phyllobacterium endophyticum]
MSLCLLAAGKTAVFSATVFSLAWTHSVERTRWEEVWHVDQDGLRIVEARIRGSGAGMEPPEGAVLRDGWWIFTPKVPMQKKLVLAASGATSGGWTFCADDMCRSIGASASEPLIIKVCKEPS